MGSFQARELGELRGGEEGAMEQNASLRRLIDRIAAPVEQGTVLAGKMKIRTSYIAAGKGPPVLLLHGADAGATTWFPSIGPLSAPFRVLAPDVVGYGESDKPAAAYDRLYFAGWLRDFLDALEIPAAVVVGNSQGGAIALQFALDYPGRVNKLVLVDAGGLGRWIAPGALAGLIWLNTFPSAAAVRWLGRYLVDDQRCVPEDCVALVVGVRRMPGGTRVFWRGRRKPVAPVSRKRLAQINHETLVVWGERVRFFPRAHARAAQKVLPRARLRVIADAGHIPFLDQPAAFNEALIGFIKGESGDEGRG
jgi:4,5:9,10-diseco-3-hydroxy-5,9,17-trioxoandrosta-1(10),2-diene-4-oate hydrolase